MNKEILRLAVPNIISNISVPLLSTVDTALMGQISPLHIGAVGIGSMIFNFIYWNFGFLRMGTTGLTAQAFGRKDNRTMSHTFGRALLIAGAIALIMLIFQRPFGAASFDLMGVEGEQKQLVADYFYVRIWAAPATFCLYVLMGWFFGMQNAVFPLILTVAINAVNIVMNLIFVRYYGMGVEGVAWGTVIAQYFGIFLGVIMLIYRYKAYLFGLRDRAVLQWTAFRAFLILNRDIFIRTLFLTFVFAFFHAKSAGLGTEILAVNIILLQFVSWMSFGIDGFAYASESLVGKYFGAGDEIKTRRAVKLSFVWSLVAVAICMAIYGFLRDPLLAIFTRDTDVIVSTGPYYFWVVLLPIFAFASYIWDGVFVGLTASKSMRNSMALSLVVYLAVYVLTIDHWGNHGLWLALMAFLLSRGILQTIMYWRSGLQLQ